MLKFGTLGDLTVLCAALFWAIGTLYIRKYVKHLHAGIIVFYRYIISVFAIFLYLLFSSKLPIITYTLFPFFNIILLLILPINLSV